MTAHGIPRGTPRWASKPLSDLAEAVGLSSDPSWSDVAVRGICEDSRRLRAGDLFVALSGAKQDGRLFVQEAVAQGAVAVAVEEPVDVGVPCLAVPDGRRALAELSAAFFDHPTRKLRTVGVTGTNGKTTVCHWVAHLLSTDRTALLSTVTNAESLPTSIAGLTTPPSPIIQRLAREAVDDGAETLILEASSIGLAQGRLDAVAFDVCAFTNLTHDHLDLHGDAKAYASAKARLFESLGSDGWAVVNADDPAAERMLDGCRGRPLRVSQQCPADLRAVDIRVEEDATRFLLVGGSDEVKVRLPVIGLYNVQNALVAAGIAICCGVGLHDIADRLGTVRPVPGRQRWFRDQQGRTAVVDFAHNPDAMERVLRTLRPRHRRVAVLFGCPGGSDRTRRRAMGEISGRWADLTILTSDNPKHETPRGIAEEIAVGVRGAGGGYEIVIDRAAAISRALAWAEDGDCVLVAGKGHERVQLVGDERVPYSDRDVLESLGLAPASPGR